MRFSKLWFAMLPAAMAVVVAGLDMQVAAQDRGEQEGQIIQIGPDQNHGDDHGAPRGLPRDRQVDQPGFPDQRQVDLPAHWIGLMGGPVGPELRHHVELPANGGLLVLEVVPDSPAEEAGLQQFDIMLEANDVELTEMADLVELVRTEGERQGQIAIEVSRAGQRETVWVTPTERPADAHAGRPLPGAGNGGMFGRLFRQFGRRPDGGFEGRTFGPGVAVGGQQLSVAQLPNGVSVQVEKRIDQPTKITVERDGETWEIEGDDPEALDQLPADVRPHVEQMLGNSQSMLLQQQLPQMGAELEGRQPQMDNLQGEMMQRMEEMEQQMYQLQERFHGQDAPAATESETEEEEVVH